MIWFNLIRNQVDAMKVGISIAEKTSAVAFEKIWIFNMYTKSDRAHISSIISRF